MTMKIVLKPMVTPGDSPILGRPPKIFLVDSQCSTYFLTIGFLACRSRSQVVETGHPFIYAYILA